ncbi:MAG: HAMP domain-containing sensor histidine kinase [Elusimicrobiota bacterium]
MVKIIQRIFKYGWKYYFASIIFFILFWQTFSVIYEVKVSKDKLLTSMRQNALYFEKSFLEGDVFEVQRIMWRIKNDNIKRIIFYPVFIENGKWLFGETLIGNIYRRPYLQITGETTFISNGAKLGKLKYVIDLFDINSLVFKNNYPLFATVIIFFIALIFLSNMGTLKTIYAIEKGIFDINDKINRNENEKIKSTLLFLPKNLKDTPFEDLIKNYTQSLSKVSKLERELAVSKAVSDLSLQVAHDIRSPLAALESGLKDAQVTQGNKELINNALKRINSIAEDLLDKYRNKNKCETKQGQERSGQSYPDLDQIIEEVIKEKKRIYPDINFIFTKSGKDIKVNIDGKDISRIISNLINNGAEAINDKKKGIIEVITKKENGKAKIIVKDNGKGIPEDMINKLGEKGFTYGKEGGNGLGIWDAKNKIESAGGEIKISSKINIGSEIEIILPIMFVKTIVLIDDDNLVRKNWEIEARRKNMAIKTYSNPKDFLERIEEFPRDILIYVDGELGEGLKGEEICRLIYEKGFENIYMETGHKEERFKEIVYIKGVIGKEFPVNLEG